MANAHHRIVVYKPAENGIEPWLNLSKAAQLLQSRPERSGWQQNRGDRVDSSPTEWTLDLQPRRSRVITGTRYFRAYAAEPKIPHGIASRSAEALLFNYMGVFDARL